MWTLDQMKEEWRKKDLEYLEWHNIQIEEYKVKVNKYLFDPVMRKHMQDMLIMLKQEKFICEGEYRDSYGTDPIYSQRLDRAASQ